MIRWNITEATELEKDARTQDLGKSFIQWTKFLTIWKFKDDWLKLLTEKRHERRGIRSENRWKECKKNRKRGEEKMNGMKWSPSFSTENHNVNIIINQTHSNLIRGRLRVSDPIDQIYSSRVHLRDLSRKSSEPVSIQSVKRSPA